MTFKAQKWRQVVGSGLTNLTAEYTLPCHKRPYSIFFKYKSFRVKEKKKKDKKVCAKKLVKPVCCMLPQPASTTIAAPSLNWNVNSPCRKIFAFLAAALTSQLYTVNLKLLFHYLFSTKLSLGCCYTFIHAASLPTSVFQSEAYAEQSTQWVFTHGEA